MRLFIVHLSKNYGILFYEFVTYYVTLHIIFSLLLGETGSRINSNLITKYIISVAKFVAWKERNSYQFNSDKKTSCLQYFKY
jgi:hypothetical protein